MPVLSATYHAMLTRKEEKRSSSSSSSPGLPLLMHEISVDIVHVLGEEEEEAIDTT